MSKPIHLQDTDPQAKAFLERLLNSAEGLHAPNATRLLWGDFQAELVREDPEFNIYSIHVTGTPPEDTIQISISLGNAERIASFFRQCYFSSQGGDSLLTKAMEAL